MATNQSEEHVPQTTSSFDPLLLELREHCSWPDFLAFLKERQIGTAIGWTALAKKFDGLDGAGSQKTKSVLLQLLRDLTLAGTKEVQIHELAEAAEVEAVAQAFEALPLEDNAYRAKHPFCLSPDELLSQQEEYVLENRVVHPSGDVSLVFSSSRSYFEKVQYRTDEVTAAVRQAFLGFDQFVAMRRVRYQIRDVLTIRKTLKRLEVLIDRPDRIAKPETVEDRCLQLLSRVQHLTPALTSIFQSRRPLNLFGCINSMYSTKSEGRVTKMSFRAPTKSVMREAVAGGDLRLEPYHVHGKAAVGDITPYDVTVAWATLAGAEGSPSARVQSSLSALSNASAEVRSARVTDVRNDGAMVVVVNKLVSHSTGT